MDVEKITPVGLEDGLITFRRLRSFFVLTAEDGVAVGCISDSH